MANEKEHFKGNFSIGSGDIPRKSPVFYIFPYSEYSSGVWFSPQPLILLLSPASPFFLSFRKRVIAV